MGLSEHVVWKPPEVCFSFVKPVFPPFNPHTAVLHFQHALMAIHSYFMFWPIGGYNRKIS